MYAANPLRLGGSRVVKNGPCLFRVDHFGAQELCPQGWAPCSSYKDSQSQAPWQELSSVNTTGKEQLPRDEQKAKAKGNPQLQGKSLGTGCKQP